VISFIQPIHRNFAIYKVEPVSGTVQFNLGDVRSLYLEDSLSGSDYEIIIKMKPFILWQSIIKSPVL
jgi:hypothetical protein